MKPGIDRAAAIHALEARVDGDPAAMVALARQKAAIGDRAGVARLCLAAIEDPLCPPDARIIAAELLGGGVPRWHFAIVRDKLRNQAYRQALEQAVTPGCTVLEIGTGTGLLAMMAAQAGAGRVFTCEADPAVAMAAERVIARNGLSDRVRVIARHSSAIAAEADLGGPADILVSEIVSNDLLGEEVLDAMEDAVGRLVRPDGAIIPARGRILVALAEDLKDAVTRMPADCDFDLSPFDILRKPFREVPVRDPSVAMRSDPAILFEFDFRSGGPYRPESTSLRLASHGGAVGGTIQWIELDMDDSIRHQNRPGGSAGSCWASIFRPFFRTLPTAAGEIVELWARHDRNAIHVWTK
ncbi:MAG TPA: 50S ribosomal protein L11 methyltransferase [Allosphingosinicella sp.]|nr:50S ribosomal protein L11 methyltransferase [Allosphingosinicella sp.]